MSKQRQSLETLSPQIVISATPTRVSTEDKYVRSVIIEAAEENCGKIYIADSEAKATTLNRHVLYNPGDTHRLEGDSYGSLDATINLKDIFIHGNELGDRVVISVINIDKELC